MSRFSTLLVATVAVATLFVLASPVEAVSLRARLGVPVSVGGMPPAVPSHHPIMVVHRDSDHLLWKPTIEPSSWLGIHLGSPKYQFKSSRRGSTILLTAVNASEIHATHADHLVEEIVNFITLAQLNGLQLVVDVSEAAIVHEEVATRIATDLFPLAQKSNVGFIVLYNPSSKGTLAATQALQKAAGGFTRVQVISVLDYDKQVAQDAAVSSA